MALRRRPSKPALLKWERVGWLRFRFLRLYGDDTEFQQKLAKFEEGQHEDLRALVASLRELWQLNGLRWRGGDDAPVADAYLEDLEQLAKRFGIHRYGASERTPDGRFRPSEGEQVLHLWCHESARSRLGGGKPLSPAEFAFVEGFGGSIPDFEPMSSSNDSPSRPRSSSDSLESVDESGRPIVHVVVTSFWDPRSEAQLHVKKRLLAMAEDQIDVEIERIARRTEEIGFHFNSSSNATRDLTWLFLKIRHGWSYGDIAGRWKHDLKATAVDAYLHRKMPVTDALAYEDDDRARVQKAVIRMADLIGISRTDW